MAIPKSKMLFALALSCVKCACSALYGFFFPLLPLYRSWLFIKMQFDYNYLMGRYTEDGSRLFCKVHSNRQVTTREILFRCRNFTMAVVKYWDRLLRDALETLFLEILRILLSKPHTVQVSFEHLQPPVWPRFKATSTGPSQAKLFYDSVTDRWIKGPFWPIKKSNYCNVSKEQATACQILLFKLDTPENVQHLFHNPSKNSTCETLSHSEIRL